MRKAILAALTLISTLALGVTSYAGVWKQERDGRWWYLNDDGKYIANSWEKIDGKDYYFNEEGYLLVNTTTPDGYQVGADGAKVENAAANPNNAKIYRDSLGDHHYLVYSSLNDNEKKAICTELYNMMVTNNKSEDSSSEKWERYDNATFESFNISDDGIYDISSYYQVKNDLGLFENKKCHGTGYIFIWKDDGRNLEYQFWY